MDLAQYSITILIGLIILFFWFFKQVKSFLFWTYLWQFKNYHIGRFLAHFNTYNGRRTIINRGLAIKYIIFFFLLILFSASIYEYNKTISSYLSILSTYVIYSIPLLLLIYFIEGVNSLWGLIRNRIVLPQFTSKIIFLLPIIFIPLLVITTVLGIMFIDNYNNPYRWIAFDLVSFSFIILAFDVLTPLIVSFVILLFQPITVFFRGRIIKGAIKKRESMEYLTVIGITGSYGKSSTKEFLKTILEKEFKIIATEKNENSEMGISQCILNNLKEEHEIFICEMGAYNRGGIKLLCEIAKPKIGILTGINNQHLATFGSQNNIVKAKFELIDSLPMEGLAVLNWDNEFIKDNFNSTVSSMKYSLYEKQDLWAEDIKETKEGISFKVITKMGESHIFKAKVIGIHNVSNILAAIAVAKKLGMSLEDIAERVKEINSEQGGMKINKFNNIDIINATYSSNANGLISHLEFMKNWEGKKILVMPCLIELGSNGKEAHYKMGRKIGEVCDLAIITSRDYFKEIRKGAVEMGMKREEIIFMNNGEEIFKKISSVINFNDVVLLESRVPVKLINKLNE